MLRKIVFFVFIVPCVLGLAIAGNAQAALVPNGDFETGDLTGWNYSGDAGVSDVDVIDGSYSGYLTNNGIGGMCSFLWTSNVTPVNEPKEVIVSFRVRYNTNECGSIGGTGKAAQVPLTGCFYDDPFHAVLKTGAGDVNLVTIGTAGINSAQGFTLQYFDSGVLLPPPPAAPIFEPGLLFVSETPTILVSGRIPYTSCDPVYLRFDVCNTVDNEVYSGAIVDDVDITVVEAAATPMPFFWAMNPTPVPTPCPQTPVMALPGR